MNKKNSTYWQRVGDYIIDSDHWRFDGIIDHKYSPILWLRAMWASLWNADLYEPDFPRRCKF